MNLFYGKSVKGELVLDNKRAFTDYLSSVDGKKLVIQIDKEKSVRSLNQNSYYWFYLRLVANETGHTEQELHSLFKRIFLPPEMKVIMGRTIKLPATTTKLNKIEFGEYMERICAETNVPLPDPKEVNYIV